MSLPIPNLDDKTFSELVEEARKVIPIYATASKWTDHNVHDPGITFMELFAWLSEMQLYSLDFVSDAHLLKYLALLGMKPEPARPAKVDLQLTPTFPQCKTIPKGSLFQTGSSETDFTFETLEEIEVIPLQIKKVICYSGYQYTDMTEFNEHPKTYYHPFGEYPLKGDAFYIGLALEGDRSNITGKRIRIAVYPYEADLPVVGKGLPGEEEYLSGITGGVLESSSGQALWEYWNNNEWTSLDITSSNDPVSVFLARGTISFYSPADLIKGIPPEFPSSWSEVGNPGWKDVSQLWVRCRLLDVSFDITPRLDRLLLNVVTAVEGRTYSMVEVGSGLPYQVVKLEMFPVIAGSETVTIDGVVWKAAADFDASGPGDFQYVLNPAKGEIYFGDGVNGAVPLPDKSINIVYWSGGGGGGQKGNIDADMVTGSQIDGITVTNPFPADGGKDGETIDDAFIRFKRDLVVPYTAVTEADYEYIVKQTPGLRVARVAALAQDAKTGSENETVIIAIPYSFAKCPVPSRSFKRAVCKYLDMHRLITTSVQVCDPDYIGVSVSVKVKIKPGFEPVQMKDRIKEALDDFLAPLDLGGNSGGSGGWPFGRAVYRSEVNEVLEGVEGVDCVISLSLSAVGKWFEKRDGDIIIGSMSLVYPGAHQVEVMGSETKCKNKSFSGGF
jgi:predicted phage baseplate assembly protein